jgi:hypothetical protein
VRAQFTGFRATERTGVILETNGNLRVDFSMQAGEQTQTVTVTEALPLVETTTASPGGTLQSDIVEQLPLNGRNFSNLLQLRPGVTIYPGGAGWAQSTNGMRAHDNTYMVDGISGSDPWMAQAVWDSVMAAGDAGTMISVDSIDEFKTEVNPKAQFGFKPGGVVNVGIKSGTNAIHGTAFAYGRDRAWDARNYFYSTLPESQIPSATLEQWGATVGGPVLKDKLFYFMSFEEQRLAIGSVATITSPVTAGNTIFDPSVGNGTKADSNLIAGCQAALAVGPVGSGIPGSLTALSAQLAGLSNTCQPLSNYPGIFPTNNGSNPTGNGIKFIPNGLFNTNRIDSGLGKVNYHLGDKNSISGMYYISPGAGIQNDSPSSQSQPAFLTNQYARSQAFAGNWTWTPNGAWVNEVRVGYSHYYQSFLSVDANQDPSNYSFNGSTYHIFTGQTNPFYFGLPGINTGIVTLGAGWPKIVGPDGVLQITDHVSWLKGAHSFMFGGEVVQNKSTSNVTANAKGPIAFDGLQDFFAGIPGAAGTYAYCTSAFASAPVAGSCSGSGTSASILTGNLLRHFTYNGVALFLQDDYRVRPRIILNLGLRWEMTTVQKEANNLQANFNPATGLVQGSPYAGDHNNISPRLGLAWDIFGNGKTVFRAGGSVLYEQLSLDVFNGIGNSFGLRANPTGASNVNCSVLVNPNLVSTCKNAGGVPVITAPTGTIDTVNIALKGSPAIFNGGPTAPVAAFQPGSIPYNWANNSSSTSLYNFTPACGDGFTTLSSGALNGLTPAACQVMMVDPNLRTPYVLQWNADIQRQLTSGISITVGYVGNHGTKLISALDLNQPSAVGGFSSGWGNPADPSSAAFACIASAGPAFTSFSSKACSPNKNLETYNRPLYAKFPYYSFIPVYGNLDSSNYSGMQAVLTARNYHGVSMTAGYTWSHALGVSSDQGTGGNNQIPNDSTQPLRPQLYGPTVFDIRHRGTLSVTYAMPEWKKVRGGLLGGWSVNAVTILQTGLPWQTSDSSTDFSGTGEGLSGGSTAATAGQRWNFFGNPADWTPNHNFNNVAPIVSSTGAGGAPGIPYYLPGAPPAANPTDPAYAVNNANCVSNVGGKGATLAYAALFRLGCYQLGSGVLVPPAFGSSGTLPKLPFRGAGFHNADASVTKAISITERFKAQIRAEVFNIFNTPHFVTPGNSVGGNAGCSLNPTSAGGGAAGGGSGLGCVTATPDQASSNPVLGSGGSRAFQFGMKILF